MTWLSHVRGVGLLACVIFATAGVDYFDLDEFECEQAVAQLRGCCPDLPYAAIDCTIGVCDTADFTRSESECIQSRSCAELEELGYCDFEPALPTTTVSSSSGGRELQCP